MDAVNHAEQLIDLPYDESDAPDASRFRHVAIEKGLLFNAWVLARDSNILTSSPSQSLISIVLCIMQIVLTFSLIKGPGTLVWWHYFDTTRVLCHLLLRVLLLYFQYRLTQARILQGSGGDASFIEPQGSVFAIQIIQFGLWVSNLFGIMLGTILPFFLLFGAVAPNLESQDVALSFSLAGLTALLHILATIPQIAIIKKDLALAQVQALQRRTTAAAAADSNANRPQLPARPPASRESKELRQAMAAIARMELKAKQDLEYQQAMATDAAVQATADASRAEAFIEQPEPVVQGQVFEDLQALPSHALSKEAVFELKKARLGEEPPATLREGVVSIQVRFPSGKVMRRRFLVKDSLQSLFDAVDTFSREGLRGASGEDISTSYEIQCNFPRLTLDPLSSPDSSTFESLGLNASHSFFIKEKVTEEETAEEN